jgi:hypothetical protein
VYAASDAGAAIDRDSGNRIGRACGDRRHKSHADVYLYLPDKLSKIQVLTLQCE